MKPITTLPFVLLELAITIFAANTIAGNYVPFIEGSLFIGIVLILSIGFALANRYSRWWLALALVWGTAIVLDCLLMVPLAIANHWPYYDLARGAWDFFYIHFNLAAMGYTLIFGLGWNHFGSAILLNGERCVECGNQVLSGWLYCPLCGHRTNND